MAMSILHPDHPRKKSILSKLSLPPFIKEDLNSRLKPYLEAVQLDGYDKRKIRKMIMLGNKGILCLSKLIYLALWVPF